MKQLIKKILKEESLKQDLINSIEEYGYLDTAEMVGGFKNLFNIIGEERAVDLLMSCFTDLHLTKRNDSITLYDWSLPMIKKYKNSRDVDHSSIAVRILTRLGDDGVALYKKYKDDFINELISRFPELSDKNI
jgi:hypothetical protein